MSLSSGAIWSPWIYSKSWSGHFNMCWSSQPHTSYVNPLYRTVPHAHSHVNVPILIDSVTNLRVPLGVRLRDSSSAISACMTSYHSMVRCSLGCLARVQYPGDHSVTQSGKCTRCMEGYQLDGTIRPCHQSRTPRDWYWCSLVGGGEAQAIIHYWQWR